MKRKILYLGLWKVFLNPFNDIINIVEIEYVDDNTVLNTIVNNNDGCYRYIIVTAINSKIAEYKVKQLLWRG